MCPAWGCELVPAQELEQAMDLRDPAHPNSNDGHGETEKISKDLINKTENTAAQRNRRK